MPALNPTEFSGLRKGGLDDVQIAERARYSCSALEFLSALLDSGGHGELRQSPGKRRDLWVYRNKQEFDQRVEPTLVLWP